MQEYGLIGQISGENHSQVLQQCAGVSRMQPIAVEELHLIFKAKPPPGLADLQKSSGGGSQGVVPPEFQKTRTMLNASLYFIQIVGTTKTESKQEDEKTAQGDLTDSGDVPMPDVRMQEARLSKPLNWVLEFRDTPDPGKQPVTSRLMYKIPILEGDVTEFMNNFGFEYISRYVVIGHKFYDQDVTLFLQRIMRVSNSEGENSTTNVETFPQSGHLESLAKSNKYLLSATIESTDGSNSELRERAVRQLLMMKETMKGAVNLVPGDRLALDTKVPASLHR